VLDYTSLPGEMDRQILTKDQDGALRTTILKVSEKWSKTYFRSLLDTAQRKSLSTDDQRTEKNKAFDLLDALSRSGDLQVADTSTHVILPATHCFTKSLIDTVVQDNINPIERVERSVLLLASLVHSTPVPELVNANQLSRVHQYSPMLFSESESESKAIEDKSAA
jgi:hypothetical protein